MMKRGGRAQQQNAKEGGGGMDAIERMLYGDVDDDPDLEAELLAMQAEVDHEDGEGDEVPPPPPSSSTRKGDTAAVRRSDDRGLVRRMPPPSSQETFDDFDKLARQISAEVVVEDDLNDESVDDDGELLAELDRFVGPMSGGSAAADDHVIIEEDVAPPPPAAPPRGNPSVSATSTTSIVDALQQHLEKCRSTAVKAAQDGDSSKERRMARICKQYENAISDYKARKPVNFDELPVPPGCPPLPVPRQNIACSAAEADDKAGEVDKAPPPPPPPSNTRKADDAAVKGVDSGLVRKIPPPPPPSSQRTFANSPPTSIVDALQQRMEKYRSTAVKAAEDGDSSKERRMARICKQYENAIRDYKARKPVNFDELPVPPGFPPLPVPRQNAAGSANAASTASKSTPSLLPADGSSKRLSSSGSSGGLSVQTRIVPSAAKLSRQEQQLNFLLERQRQFKCAALDAKRRGDLASAKNFLRQALGFNQMIEASRNGLPVDISNTPTPPQSKTAPRTLRPTVGAAKASSDLALDKLYGPQSEGSALVRENREESYASLEADLIRQVQLCDHNRDYFTKFGDVSKVQLFEKLGSVCKKELDSLRNGFRHGDPVPRFHYETRAFPVLHCCPDLGVEDLEIQVVRGLMLKLPSGYEPKDADIFVKFDFPLPKDSPQTGRTLNVRGTNSPTFNHNHKMKVNTKSRQFLIAYKRHGVKFEVYQKGSLFRSDKSLGTAEVKLLAFENKAEIHESLDLMEGRKPVGGKLEVKIRIREPLLHKTVEESKEKWLIIDEFIRIPKGVLAKNRLIPDMM